MTLANIPRYQRGAVGDLGEHAVVVGAGMAGTLAARVLSDGFESVTVVERDTRPEGPVPRKGVPQSSHPHGLLEGGRATIEDLFPDYGEKLLSAGGLIVDAASDLEFYHDGGYLADGPTRRPMYYATRPLIEYTAQNCLERVDNVNVRFGCNLLDYLTDSRDRAVTGVAIRDRDSGREELPADLVVDATGRTSRTPSWLEDHGFPTPPVEEVEINVDYRTFTVERPPESRRTIFAVARYPRTRGGVIFPQEDGRWLVNVHDMHGESPPSTPEGIADFIPIPEMAELIREQPVISDDVEEYPLPSSRRRYYEDLDRFPEGLVVTGDAIASFNPIYGQGITMGAFDALLLHHTLADGGTSDVGRRFFDRAGDMLDVGWTLSVGGDLQHSETKTTGSKPIGADLFNRYLSRVLDKARHDGKVRAALLDVLMAEKPPTRLLRPDVMARVATPQMPSRVSVSFARSGASISFMRNR